MIINEITKYLEQIAPLSYQENYDNSGLIVGNSQNEITGILISLDVTGSVLDEAISLGFNLIISHHPPIFFGLKKLINRNFTEKIVMKAIKNDISLYCGHTNFDNILNGINGRLGAKLKLKNVKILSPKMGELRKLITFVPESHGEKVRSALFLAGAGNIGNYDCCSFNAAGEGTFRGMENANPFVGEIGKIHFEKETKIEVIFPKYRQNSLIDALLKNHPYEEVAYDIFALENSCLREGSGVIGDLEEEVLDLEFLTFVKKSLNIPVLRHSKLLGKKVRRIALCGGAGAEFLSNAISQKADVFLTSDIKYHQFFEADDRIIFADFGHFESESVAREMFFELILQKFTEVSVKISEINTNSVNYL